MQNLIRTRFSMPEDAISLMQSLGYRVYMRNAHDSWAIYEDTAGIGYVQYDPRGFSVSTKHAPNTVSGTGYVIADGVPALTAELLHAGIHIRVPYWHRRDAAPRKYRSMAEYMNADRFNAGYSEVPATAKA